MTHTISNSDDVIDSRDIIARIEELEDEFQSWKSDAEETAETEGRPIPTELTIADWAALDESGEELVALKSLADEASGYAADWKYGETMIRESYFIEYCQELCEDIGDLPKNLPSYIEIDWEATARNLKADYTEVEYDGVTYLVR